MMRPVTKRVSGLKGAALGAAIAACAGIGPSAAQADAPGFAAQALDICLSGRQPAAVIEGKLKAAGWRPVAAARSTRPGVRLFAAPADGRIAAIDSATDAMTRTTLVTCVLYDATPATAPVAKAVAGRLGVQMDVTPLGEGEALHSYMDQTRNTDAAMFSVNISIGRVRAPDEVGHKAKARPVKVQVSYVPAGGSS